MWTIHTYTTMYPMRLHQLKGYDDAQEDVEGVKTHFLLLEGVRISSKPKSLMCNGEWEKMEVEIMVCIGFLKN